MAALVGRQETSRWVAVWTLPINRWDHNPRHMLLLSVGPLDRSEMFCG